MDTDSIKRLLIFVFGFGALFLHNKFGVDLSAADIAALSGILATFIAQSAARSIAADKLAQQASGVASPAAAVAILNSVPPPVNK